MSNIVGEGFPDAILKQINQRQKIYGSRDRNNEILSYLNSRTGWVKMVSSVNLTQNIRDLGLTGSKLAEQYVLFNGTTNESPRAGAAETYQKYGVAQSDVKHTRYAYGVGGLEFGLRPMPGIMQASIKTETRGSLKTATVQIKAHNRVQFDIIDLLYMRLGYSMLLEWGHTSYYDNSGNFIEDNPYSLADDFLTAKFNYDQLYPEIARRRLNSCGNYDAVVGKVVNFSWTFNKDGSYDITVILRSMGDVIESMKVGILLPDGNAKDPEEQEDPPVEDTDPTDDAEQVIVAFKDANSIGKMLYDKMTRLSALGEGPNGEARLTAKKADGSSYVAVYRQKYDGGPTQYYVHFGWFLQWIEKNLILNCNGGLNKLVKIDTDPSSNIIYLEKRQMWTDPRICAFNIKWNYPSSSFVFLPTAENFVVTENGNRYGYVMNIYFNFTFIIESIKQSVNSEKELSIYDLLKTMCVAWNTSTGNFNQLEPIIEEETNTLKIVDSTRLPDTDKWLKKFGQSTTPAVFDVFGYGFDKNGVPHAGFIKDFSFQTSIPPNLATMITVGATSNGYVVGQDATALSRMNNGLVDRIKTTISNPGEVSTPPTTSSLEEKYAGPLDAFNSFLSIIGAPVSGGLPQWNEDIINTFQQNIGSFIEYDQAKQTLAENKKADTSASSPNTGFLPFNLSLTMDGMSGMKVYQKYTVDTTYLPSNYPTALDFLISGITNNIVGNVWETQIESIGVPKNPFGSGATSDVPSNFRAKERGSGSTSGPISAGKIGSTWAELPENKKASARYLYNTLTKDYGFTDTEARAILGVVSKESNFAPVNEIPYTNTSAARIKQVWPGLFGSKSDAEVDRIKKNEVEFWDLVYGYNRPGKNGNFYGNNQPGDGKKYLGRGFNGLTFKGNYEVYNKLYKDYGSKAGSVDIINNPDVLNRQENGVYPVASHFCALYFKRNKSNYFSSAPTNDIDTAIYNFMRANAGWGTSPNGAIFQEGLGKAKKFVNSLPADFASGATSSPQSSPSPAPNSNFTNYGNFGSYVNPDVFSGPNVFNPNG